ncbi:hypothetical protein PYCCODRAFT_556312 [Trametes coccinea BRFM310]|uniref:Uncharacterized protein n=1 Tax=Trametes coccinea (strain BRFM310) TaxID=1353009 RepID=A0A1Y2IKQ3_TRAC3|nr:hypothetical protein PYCCODRAFT_556312 [Trametes coccinea BRFM310]
MVKSREDVIAQFHEEVNMTADELEKWLEDPKSSKAGTGVGIESGHKIVEILRKNPDRDPEQYDEVRTQRRRYVGLVALVLNTYNAARYRAYAQGRGVSRAKLCSLRQVERYCSEQRAGTRRGTSRKRTI